MTTKRVKGIEKVLSYPLWEAIADNLASTIEFCFSEGMTVNPSLIEIVSDRENYRCLGGVSPLVNEILWGSTVQLGRLAHRSGKPPREVFTQWLNDRRFECPGRRFCSSGRGQEGYSAKEAMAWFLSVLRAETGSLVKGDQVGPNWLKDVFYKHDIPDPQG